MNAEKLMQVLRQPHTSEKASNIAEKQRQYTFKVLKTATKEEIKAAVESIFNVKVQKVTVLNMDGKRKRFKQSSGKRNDWKKAYVSLYPEYDIDFAATE